ncbi:fused DSP-PTPase phosphatase/NAD kinase-like protein [Stagnihabitans tardus]|uniref:Protein tyrosine phosphatase n=1 Tax=Stagnihabitans tardus TaxID=2699202 RepID=A0AAE4YA01_9RHOB|nr:tyrosine-protein phosphatase [Stagnihabitans tardus]NBZ88737.1 protein tyrosine phosphatase [Stagnihabitans tardus]
MGLRERFLDWQRQLTAAYGSDISTPAARRAAWWHFQLMDHAFLRVLWSNLHQIAPGVWRSNQPSPGRLATWARRLGLKTVINLRGRPQEGFFLFEQEATERLGLTRIDLSFSARRAPHGWQLVELVDLLTGLQKPVLIHCKSGADRTGLAAAIYLLAVEGKSLQEAMGQLSLRYLHLRRSKTGIMDEILLCYGEEARGRSFRQWAEEDYDRLRITESFKRRLGGAPRF